jgi:hypothetical protein
VLTILVVALWPLVFLQLLGVAMTLMTQFEGGMSRIPTAVQTAAPFLVFAAMVAGVFWILYALCSYSLAVPACILENLSPKEARLRSKLLTRKNLGRVFIVYLLTFTMGFALITAPTPSLSCRGSFPAETAANCKYIHPDLAIFDSAYRQDSGRTCCDHRAHPALLRSAHPQGSL